MKKLIIKIEEGIISGVYTNLPEDIEVLIKDSDDRYEEERTQEYHRLQQLIDHGCVKDILYQEITPEEESSIPSMLNPDVLLIIKEANTAKTDNGKRMQQLTAAFIDGYLTAHAEITRFIWKMHRSKDKEIQKIVCLLSKALKPLVCKQNDHYFKLCEFINQPGFFDQAESESQT